MERNVSPVAKKFEKEKMLMLIINHIFSSHKTRFTVSSPSASCRTNSMGTKRCDTPSDMEKELTKYTRQSTKAKEPPDKQLENRPPKTAEDALFESCALRMKVLPPPVRSFLQL